VAKFPTSEWLPALVEKLNSDQRYAQIARNWEGDMLVQIEPGGSLNEPIVYYLDLWHGKCRQAYPVEGENSFKAAFTLKAPYENYVRLLKGELEPMQALLTRKLGLTGNMAILMRNVPTVLDFVRCCREITDAYLST
jgi:putative sterol carrier protein